MVAARLETFLRERTAGVKHSGRDFYEHLKGVHDLLRDWGAPEHVCVAGLFHSVYGTKYFHHSTLKLDTIDEFILNGLVGLNAGRLVREFCTAEDRYRLSDPELLEIEAANQIEQGNIPTKMRRMLWNAPISASARWALLCSWFRH